MISKKPRYIDIAETIVKKIESGEFQPGDKIPSENEIIRLFKVSNTTARKSLQYLEIQGWASRIKGKGTFVLNKTADKHLTRTLGSVISTRAGFDENLTKEGFIPKNVILEKTVVSAGISIELSGKYVKMDGPLLKIQRLRFADDILLKDETKFISLDVCPEIHLIEPENSYYNLYEKKYGLKLAEIKQNLGSTIFYKKSPGNYFESEAPLPVFILESAVSDSEGRIVEIEKSFYRGDKYKFTIVSNPELS